LTSVISSSPRRRAQGGRDVDDLVVVEVETGHRVGRARLRGLLLDADRAAGVVELDDSVALGIADAVGEHGRPARLARGPLQRLHEVVPVEDVVAEGEGDASDPTKPRPMTKAWARPSGRGWAS
jgi:hypothetical protein